MIDPRVQSAIAHWATRFVASDGAYKYRLRSADWMAQQLGLPKC